MSGHNYHDEAVWGPQGPFGSWDRPDGTQGTYAQRRESETWHMTTDYQRKFLQVGPDGFLLNSRGW